MSFMYPLFRLPAPGSRLPAPGFSTQGARRLEIIEPNFTPKLAGDVSSLRSRVDHQRVCCDDRDVLFPVAALIGDRVGIPSSFELRHPQFLSVRRVERAEPVVVAR